MSTSADALQAGRTALARFVEHTENGDQTAAGQAADQAVRLDHPAVLGPALNCLGLARYECGDLVGAADAFRGAAQDHRPPVRLFALVHTGVVLRTLGETDEAGAALDEVARSAHPDLAPHATHVLAELLREQGDIATAISAYRQVVDSGHPQHRPKAAAALGALLYDTGDLAGAQHAFAQADDAAATPLGLPGPAETAASQVDSAGWVAAVECALRRWRAGDLAGARGTLRPVADSGWRGAADQAATALAGIALVNGDVAEAGDVLTRVALGEDFSHGPRAALVLALLEETAGSDHATVGRFLLAERGALRAAWALVSDRTDRKRAAIGAVLLGDLLVRAGHTRLAIRWLRQAWASPLVGPYAHYLLEVLDPEAAMAENPHLAGEPPRSIRPWALVREAERLARARYAEGAVVVFAEALELNHPGLAARAYLGLGKALWDSEDFEYDDEYEAESELRELAERALVVGPTEVIPWFAWHLAMDMLVDGNLWGAQYVLEQIPEWHPEFGAAAVPGRLLAGREFAAARAALDRLAAGGGAQHAKATELCLNATWGFHAADDPASYRRTVRLLVEAGETAQVVDALTTRASVDANNGDVDSALEQWEWAAAADQVLGAEAALEAAKLRYLRGDLDAADALYHQALAGEDAETSKNAATGLAVLLTQRGDPTAAGVVRRLAGFDGHYCYNLGVLLKRAGNDDGALIAYGMAMESDEPAAAVRAAYFLGLAHRRRGDLDAAEVALQRAASLDDPEYSPKAHYTLGLIHKTRGDLAAARAAQQRAVDSGHVDMQPWGRIELARLAELAGDPDSAWQGFLELVDVPHHTVSIQAMMALGYRTKIKRDVDGALHWYGRVIDTGDADQVPWALAHLGELHYWLEDWARADRYYRDMLAATTEPELVAEAAYRLGEMCHRDGDAAEAIRFLEIARDTEHATFAPQAVALLDQLAGQPA